jgi:hypothetical protein
MKCGDTERLIHISLFGKNGSFHENIIGLPLSRLTGRVYAGRVLAINGTACSVCKGWILKAVDHLHFIA